MPNPVPNSFTSYLFSDTEAIQACILSPEGRMHIQNLRSMVAMEILSLVYNPESPLQFVQQDAHLKGQLAAYNLLLESHEDAIHRITPNQ